jgi:hypothetical protein
MAKRIEEDAPTEEGVPDLTHNDPYPDDDTEVIQDPDGAA